MEQAAPNNADIVLIGAGIMSTTLAALLKQLDPTLSIIILERLMQPATEASNAWHNAGTGHAALCELNYTPLQSDGTIKLDKAITINTSFEESKLFWSYLVKQKILTNPQQFIHSTPHMSFVTGQANQQYLRQRYETMQTHHCFTGLQYSENAQEIERWAPLLLTARKKTHYLAATYSTLGTDVDFGALTRDLLHYLSSTNHCEICYQHDVKKLKQQSDQSWLLEVAVKGTQKKRQINGRFVFIGAGGNALTLLQKSGINEAQGYGGFPVSGRWLFCQNPNVIERHAVKVYSKAAIGAPPMSVPHLDARIINGHNALLFGPFAGFTTRFMKQGSLLDLPLSLRTDNIRPILTAGVHNLSLIKYLIGQVLQNSRQRLAALQELYPAARQADWQLKIAGERVQIIKRGLHNNGELEFGTELICAKDHTLAALLGASPGASTAVSIMLDLIKRCFSDRTQSTEWQNSLKTIFPAQADDLKHNADALMASRKYSHQILQLANAS